jgi:hypothetical protein
VRTSQSGPSIGLALLLCVALAGCTTPELAAHAQERDVRLHAAGWSSDAFLFAVLAMDGDTVSAMSSDPTPGGEVEQAFNREFLRNNGSKAGDGRVPVWAYTFMSPSKPDMALHVVKGRGEAKQFELPVEGRPEGVEATPMTGWKVDSDKAASIAAASNATIESVLADPNAFALYQLSIVPGNESPVWMIFIGVLGGRSGTVVVDATTGSAQSFEDWAAGFQ